MPVNQLNREEYTLNGEYKKKKLRSLKSRIMLYTAVPVLLIIILAGSVMTFSVRSIIDRISRSEAAGSTALACASVENYLGGLGESVMTAAADDNISRFLQTAEDRDEMLENAYFGYAMGGLDSTVSDLSGRCERTWLVSAVHSEVAFSNSSDGWTASPDFDISVMPFLMGTESRDFIFTDFYTSPISGNTVISAVSPVRDYRTSETVGWFGADISLSGLSADITALPESASNEIYITDSNDIIIYSSDRNLLYRDFSESGLKSLGNGSYSGGKREFAGSEGTVSGCGWRVYALKDYSPALYIIDRQTLITIAMFLAVSLMLVIAISVVTDKIVKPIRDYTRKINSIRPDEETEEDCLSPDGCRELEQFAMGFNSLLRRNREIMKELREMNIRSEKERQLYITALQSSSDVVFEYDIKTDLLITYGSVSDPSVPKTEVYSYKDFLRSVQSGEGFSSDDLTAAAEFFSGNTMNTAVISVSEGGEGESWLEFSGTAVMADSAPVKIVGKISNIDDVISLREDASRDSFTGLYNKLATEEMISRRLSQSGTHAMMIVDTDNFKSVNDILGHAKGDDVIKEIAKKLESVLDKDDIAGRIGGDEFMLFISGDNAAERADHLCKALCESIKHTYTDESGRKSITVSASIGVACSPEYGRDFGSLYASADIAMYLSKNAGKDRYTVYSGQERSGYKGNRDEKIL